MGGSLNSSASWSKPSLSAGSRAATAVRSGRTLLAAHKSCRLTVPATSVRLQASASTLEASPLEATPLDPRRRSRAMAAKAS